MNDEHVKARGMVHEMKVESSPPVGTKDKVHEKEKKIEDEEKEEGSISLLGLPVKFSRPGMAGIRSRPPLLGEHSFQILEEVLGLDKAERERLEENGVIQQQRRRTTSSSSS